MEYVSSLQDTLELVRVNNKWLIRKDIPQQMESKVTTEFRMNDGEMLFPRFIGRIDSFHTSVKTQIKKSKSRRRPNP